MMAGGPAGATWLTYAGVVVTLFGVGLVVGFWGREVPDAVRDSWEDDMTAFARTLRNTAPRFSMHYNEIRKNENSWPETWEQLLQEQGAEWPRWHPNSDWDRDCLSSYGQNALGYAERIVDDSSADRHRHNLKLIARKWGERLSDERDWSNHFRRYVQDKISGYHSKHIKLLMYCEIAAWDDEKHPAGEPASEGLFRLAALLRRTPPSADLGPSAHETTESVGAQ